MSNNRLREIIVSLVEVSLTVKKGAYFKHISTVVAQLDSEGEFEIADQIREQLKVFGTLYL